MPNLTLVRYRAAIRLRKEQIFVTEQLSGGNVYFLLMDSWIIKKRIRLVSHNKSYSCSSLCEVTQVKSGGKKIVPTCNSSFLNVSPSTIRINNTTGTRKNWLVFDCWGLKSAVNISSVDHRGHTDQVLSSTLWDMNPVNLWCVGVQFKSHSGRVDNENHFTETQLQDENPSSGRNQKGFWCLRKSGGLWLYFSVSVTVLRVCAVK